ncbi:unnamed protein product [Rotaria magnacalcarata]|uniref:Uncharacterized protein n=2 Tax=Rotaria magnacalcarata TaxID=392030 RepID=A0A815YIX4_9BILA|nr:unnamed protein product [Rotaria magnacalcarata]CAF1571545.1 unnamed protein product [Rotaria magnacalcarata]CAF3940576.1 unnamed protein product [Rotaria magnacalcarata]
MMAQSNNDNDHYWNKNLLQVITRYRHDTKFHFNSMNLIDNDIPIIVKELLINEHCTELHLSSNRLTSEGARILAQALETNTFLELLDLTSNRLKDDGVQHLAAAFRLDRHLKYLRLGTNAITDAGAEHIARILLQNRRLCLLDLSSNELTSRGVITLAQAVPHSCLEYFYIEGNRQVNDECIDAIVTMIRQSNHLKAVSLSNIDFSQKSKLKLRQATKSKPSYFLYI